MSESVETRIFGDWTVKIRPGKSARVILLLHGWTGDENSMWAFEKLLPEDAFVIAPRAPFDTVGTDLGGYSWVNRAVDFWPTMQDFRPSVYRLIELLKIIEDEVPSLEMEDLTIGGFSQGAAMAIAFTEEFDTRVKKLAVLAGFLPDNLEDSLGGLDDLDVFISHGSNDEVISPDHAEMVRNHFRKRGSRVSMCLAQTGHRLGADCAPGLEKFLKYS